MRANARPYCALAGVAFLTIITSFGLTAGTGSKLHQPAQSRQRQPSSGEPMAGAQVTNIPYYTLRDGMDSTLTLNNVAPTPTVAKVTIFNTLGRPLVLPPVTLEPHSFKQIDLRSVIADEDFDSGNIEVQFSGLPMILTCQVSVVSLDKRISFESREQDMTDFMSLNLNGILWLPQAKAEGSLAVTNTAMNTVSVQLSVGPGKKAFTLTPRETRLIKLNEELDRRAPVATLVKLNHDGMPGDIIATGFVLDLDTGYSTSIPMVDSSIMTSKALAGAHFRSGQPDPSEGFPQETIFRAPLLLANVSEQPVKAHVSVDFTRMEKSGEEAGAAEDQSKVLPVRDLTIAPGEVQRIELSNELARLGVVGPVQEAGVDIAYDASPGSLIGQLTSLDQTGDYSFEVPVKDPAAMNEMMEGVYPWTLENGTQSVLHLKNTTPDTASAIFMIELPNGKFYNPPRIVLEPFQSVAIDIQKLKDANKPDFLKRVFPADATHGQVQWRQEIPYSMIGRLEQTNVKAGIAKSLSCGSFCCGNFTEQAYVTPNATFGLVGDSISLAARVHGTDCNAVVFDDPATSATWSSQNTSVATVDSSGNVTFVGPGKTDILAVVATEEYIIFLNKCTHRGTTQTVQVSVTVAPSVTGISPAQGPISATAPSVTITGKGLTGATVNGGTGITPTVKSTNSTTVVVDLAVASNATPGNHLISVTANGQTGNSVNFFVQVPARLVFFNTSCAPNGQGSLQVITNGSVVDCGGVSRATNFCGVNRNLTYQLVDQSTTGDPFPLAYTLSESFSNLSTTNSALGFPTAFKNVPIPANNLVTDAHFVGFTYPTCLGSNDHHSYTQNFSVTVGGVTYNLSTTVSISDGNFNATPQDNVSITTP
jgi:hypothetical protein